MEGVGGVEECVGVVFRRVWVVGDAWCGWRTALLPACEGVKGMWCVEYDMCKVCCSHTGGSGRCVGCVQGCVATCSSYRASAGDCPVAVGQLSLV